MPVPTGTRTYWHELGEREDGFVTYVRYGDNPGSPEFLAEALRMDGVMESLGPALRMAERVSLELSWTGILDDGEEVICSATGETFTGEYVDSPRPCVLARVYVD